MRGGVQPLVGSEMMSNAVVYGRFPPSRDPCGGKSHKLGFRNRLRDGRVTIVRPL